MIQLCILHMVVVIQQTDRYFWSICKGRWSNVSIQYCLGLITWILYILNWIMHEVSSMKNSDCHLDTVFIKNLWLPDFHLGIDYVCFVHDQVTWKYQNRNKIFLSVSSRVYSRWCIAKPLSLISYCIILFVV